MPRFLRTLLCLMTVWVLPALAQPELLEHHVSIQIDPVAHRLTVRDQISLPGTFPEKTTFMLHRDLQPSSPDQGVRIRPLPGNKAAIWVPYSLERPEGLEHLNIDYDGVIYHPLDAYGREQARGFRDTPGLISEQGVYLAGGSYWYPQFSGQTRFRFTLDAQLPAGWKAVSQGGESETDQKGAGGSGRAVSSWHSASPQEEIYLIAAPFTEYSRSQGKIKAQVFLREADEKLASKYLDATAKYLEMYQALLGPYPYSKFALLENFWETGFGMPSFTLLGSKVIRLPFILNSSYPHEILHNWWGNGVYVDYASGNWSEGLTAYLADHLIKEQQGQAVAYRQQSLQKYNDYAASSRDFSLSDFRSRHSSATEAVGYGKSLMLMHMLRRDLGDQVFVQALRQFYREKRFRKASFVDLRTAFEQASGRNLGGYFEQWVERSGAPALELIDSRLEPCADQSCLHLSLRQTQPGEAYHLQVPLAITLLDTPQAQQRVLSMQQKQQTYTLELPAQAVRVDIDPEFDLFRRLALEETPPAFTQVFGAQDLLVVLPDRANAEMKTAWQAFAEDLSRMGPEKVEMVWDTQLKSLPEARALVVLGWENRWAESITAALDAYAVEVQNASLSINGKMIPRSGHAVAISTRYTDQPRALIGADLPAALPGLGRKLPHYHKYSYLVFSGEEPENILKGRWPVLHSPMTALFVENAERGTLAERDPLIAAPAEYSSQRMLKSIDFLADPALQGRGFGSPGLEQAAEFIAQSFAKSGLQPGGDQTGSYFQRWQAHGGPGKRDVQQKNVIGILPGTDPNSTQSVVIGAHYDHLGLGWPEVRADNRDKVHPGADDNASGVAVLLELARVLAGKLQVERDIVFIAFSGEEAGRLGSKYYLEKQLDEKPFAMLNMDTVGRLGNNSLLVLGAESASEWPHIFRGIGFVTGIETTMVKEPLDASDHISFHEAGVPAVQLFSGAKADYHRPTDSADKIDPQGLVKVARVAKDVIEYLGGRQEPLTDRLRGGGASQEPGPEQDSRRVSLGSIPDFAFQGRGYRLDGVVPDSPAQAAGLQQGDIIIKLNQLDIAGLKDVSVILKQLQPGQMIRIDYLRNGAEHSTQARLVSK